MIQGSHLSIHFFFFSPVANQPARQSDSASVSRLPLLSTALKQDAE